MLICCSAGYAEGTARFIHDFITCKVDNCNSSLNTVLTLIFKWIVIQSSTFKRKSLEYLQTLSSRYMRITI
jgi:hypothetical protein